MSTYIGECPTCGKEYKESSSRSSHFSNAKWDYENARGKDSFKKDHPKLHEQHENLKKGLADLHVTHLKHILDKVSTETGASPVPTALTT